MKQHLESAAIALGVGVLAFIAYRAVRRPPDKRNYTDTATYYNPSGQVSGAGILDARDAQAWGGRQIGSVQ
jgi:hypothetical protein